VNCRQPRTQLSGVFRSGFLCQSSTPFEQGREIPAINALHREERLTIVFTNVVNAGNTGVGHLLGGSYFFLEQFASIRIGRETGRQEFECHRFSEHLIMGTVDDTHTPFAENHFDAIPPREDGSGSESFSSGIR